MAHQLARPAVTRHRFGSRMRELCAEAGGHDPRIEAAGVDAFTGQVRVPAGRVVVVRESPAAPNHGQE